MEVTRPASILPASQVFPRAGEGQTCSPGEGGQAPRPGAAFPSDIWHSRLGYMHMGTGVSASPLASWKSTGSRSRWRGWMSPLGAWRGRKEYGHLSSTSPLNSGASPSGQQSTGTQALTHSPGRLGLPAPVPCSQGCSVRAPSPRPGSAGRCVATSICLRDGLQRGLQPRGLWRGGSVPADAAGLSSIVDLPQVVQCLRLGMLEEISLALQGGDVRKVG